MTEHDTTILRDLAKQYVEICANPVQNERRELWRKLKQEGAKLVPPFKHPGIEPTEFLTHNPFVHQFSIEKCKNTTVLSRRKVFNVFVS